MANLCIGVLCTAVRERKAATEETTEETEDDAVYRSFEGWCTLKTLSSASAAFKVIFGVGNDSKRLRGACVHWVGRRKVVFYTLLKRSYCTSSYREKNIPLALLSELCKPW